MEGHITINVTAIWDPDAKVWAASSDDVHGLAIEASSLDQLRLRLLDVVPELLELNGPMHAGPDVPLDLLIHSQEQLSLSR